MEANNTEQTAQEFEVYSQYKHPMGVLLNTFYWADTQGHGKTIVAERFNVSSGKWYLVCVNGPLGEWQKTTAHELLKLALGE